MGGERATATEQNRARKNVYWLDVSGTDNWELADSLHKARNGMAAAVLEGKVYVFGGASGPGGPSPLEVFTEK